METGRIGIKTANGSFFPILGAEGPGKGPTARKRLVLTTVRDNQTRVQIDLYRASESAADVPGDYIGSLVVEHLAPAPKGEPDIELTIGVDADGNLNSTATDKSSGEYQSLSVELESLGEEDTFDVPDFDLDEEQFGDAELSEAFGDIEDQEADEFRTEDEYRTEDEFRTEDAYGGEDEYRGDDTRASERYEEYDFEEEGYASDDSEAREDLAVRPNALLLAGFLLISLALVGLLTYLVFLALRTPASPPLQAALVVPLIPRAFLRRLG